MGVCLNGKESREMSGGVESRRGVEEERSKGRMGRRVNREGKGGDDGWIEPADKREGEKGGKKKGSRRRKGRERRIITIEVGQWGRTRYREG